MGRRARVPLVVPPAGGPRRDPATRRVVGQMARQAAEVSPAAPQLGVRRVREGPERVGRALRASVTGQLGSIAARTTVETVVPRGRVAAVRIATAGNGGIPRVVAQKGLQVGVAMVRLDREVPNRVAIRPMGVARSAGAVLRRGLEIDVQLVAYVGRVHHRIGVRIVAIRRVKETRAVTAGVVVTRVVARAAHVVGASRFLAGRLVGDRVRYRVGSPAVDFVVTTRR